MRFEKWQACGNDFILVHSSELQAPLDPARVRALCDRRFGVGADGILVVGRPAAERWPLEIHNADGSVAESCGNGARCVVRHILDRRGLSECELATAGGVVRGTRDPAGIAIELAAPRLLGPLRVNGSTALRVDVGNPHVVVFGDEVRRVDLATLARSAREAGGDANVEAAHVRSRTEVDARVDERGVGETLACGTGACATVAAALAQGLVAEEAVTVSLPGGVLTVRPGRERYVLAGPAERVYEGSVA
jgi:diaminopimelate epimerase